MASALHSRVLTPSCDIAFVRECMLSSVTGSDSALGIRLDGRSADAFRPLTATTSSSGSSDTSIRLTRAAGSATCELAISAAGPGGGGAGGCTRVVAVVSGTIVAPYPDRPTEGIIQMNARSVVRVCVCVCVCVCVFRCRCVCVCVNTGLPLTRAHVHLSHIHIHACSTSPGCIHDAATASATGYSSAAGSGAAGRGGYGICAPTSAEITRHLERILKDGDTIDLEVCACDV